MSNLLSSVLTSALHALVAIAITGAALSLLVVVAFIAYAIHIRIVHRKVFEAVAPLQEDLNDKRELEYWLEQGADELRERLQRRVHEVWREFSLLEAALHGTTPEEIDFAWDMYCVYDCQLPQWKVAKKYSAFHVELMAIARGLTHLGSQIDSARAEHEDLVNFYKEWVEELWSNFQVFEVEDDSRQRRLLRSLSDLRKLHAEIGQIYCLSRVNSAYQQFPGMLHVLETMMDDNSVPAEEMEAYVAGFSKQLTMLAASFEKGVEKDGALIWVGRIGTCPHLEALLASFEQSKP